MILFENGHELATGESPRAKDSSLLLFAASSELAAGTQLIGLGPENVDRCRSYEAMRYDFAAGFDYALLDVPDLTAPLKEPSRLEVFFSQTALAVFSPPLPFLQDVLEDVREKDIPPTPGAVLGQLLSKLTWDDAEYLNQIEDRISDLEDSLIEAPRDCTEQIRDLRRQIISLKRYYEALLDLLEDAQENRNGLYSHEALRSIRMLHSRVERLFSMVLTLRDYVTQARESYQSQMDIQLNKIVQFLTIVTTISVPLQLIVGWYGMNLIMPEYAFEHAYPILIGLCVAITAACVVYFKKKDWF